MGTHPIFESDFDCLTEDSARCATIEWHKVQGKSNNLSIEKHNLKYYNSI